MRKLTAEQRRVLGLVRAHGRQSIAYWAIQDRMDYFFACGGVIASRTIRHPLWTLSRSVTYTLGEPIVPREQVDGFLDEFLAFKPRTVFLQVEEEVAGRLARRGFLVNRIGMDLWLDIPTFTLRGMRKLKLRTKYNKGHRLGWKVLERRLDNELQDVAREISRQWLARKQVRDRELDFLVYPICYDDEEDVRKFFCYVGEEVASFVFFTPVYGGGRVTGYVANVIRQRAGAPNGVSEFTVLKAMDRFRAEGKHVLYLGYAPLHRVAAAERFRHSRIVKRMLRAAWKYGNHLYHFQRLLEHKSKYRPEETVVYAAFPPGLHPLLAIVGAFHVTGVLGGGGREHGEEGE